MTRVIAIASAKGGVGKTTVSINLADAIARQGEHCALIEFDPQSAIAPSLGLNTPQPNHALIRQLKSNKPLVCQTPRFNPRLRVVASHPDIDTLEFNPPQGHLKDRIASLRPAPSIVLLDLAPALEPLTDWALGEADAVLLVLQPSPMSLRTVPSILKKIIHHTPPAQLDGLLVNFSIPHSTLTDNVVTSLEQNFGKWLLDLRIPFDDALQIAAMNGHPVLREAPESNAAHAFSALAQYILSRHNTPAKTNEATTRRRAAR